MISANKLCRSFGETRALVDVSFRIRRGEVAGLLGPNGAGKTTCMRILTGFTPPSSGSARVGDLQVTVESQARAARRLIGYLPEGAPIYPEMRVGEYLAFRARLRGLARGDRKSAVERAAVRCGLHDVTRRIIGQLSRGYRQRVGLADALLAEPPVLVLDEPTAGLDPNQIRDVQRLIAELAADGKTILLSSHNLSQVEAVCSRLLVLHQGQLVAEGTADELAGAGTCSLTVWVRGPGGEVVPGLAAIDGIEVIEHQVIAGEPQTVRCRLRVAPDPAARESLAAAIHQAGWGLRELRSDGAVLEEVFGELTGQPRGGRW